jgi:NTP pyrophosphatase (non-canonical NTP hydrolase)
MDVIEYQKATNRTRSFNTQNNALMCCALGMCGESGEVADIIKKHLFHGHAFDEPHLIEELGDVLWYITAMANGLNIGLEEVMQKNVDKLNRRYPDGFTEEASISRDE